MMCSQRDGANDQKLRTAYQKLSPDHNTRLGCLSAAFTFPASAASTQYPALTSGAFIAKVQADTSLQEKLKAEDYDPVAIAKAAGFSITTEDLKDHGQTLSDDELEGVAGGMLVTFTCSLVWVRQATFC